jgi:hypothetical protein
MTGTAAPENMNRAYVDNEDRNNFGSRFRLHQDGESAPMTSGYRLLLRLAKLWLCIDGLLLLHAHKAIRSPEMYYSYFIWALPPILVLVLAWIIAHGRTGPLHLSADRVKTLLPSIFR